MGKPRRMKATKSELARYAKLKELGCIIDRLKPSECYNLPVEVQHLTSGGRRIGNEHTIPLCTWHHRAQSPRGMTSSQASLLYGPSFAKSRRRFEETYGSEEFLLAETNRLLNE